MNPSSPSWMQPLLVVSSLSLFACSSDPGGTDLGTGGSTSVGGASSGGIFGAGASSTGGGGTGGAATGGVSTGGASTGGSAPTGGANSGGGFQGIGGSTGGTSTGGSGAGAAVGGSDTGGSGSGGSGGLESLTVEAFFSMACGECHGDNGDGVEGKGPDIKHPVDEGYSTHVIRNGRAAADDMYGVFSDLYEEDMSAFPEVLLPADRLREIFDFLAAQPQPTTGEGLYDDYCAACHGPDASGGLTDRPLNDVNEAFLMDVRSGHHPGEYDNRHEHMPAYSAEVLSDTEVQLIQDYVQTL